MDANPCRTSHASDCAVIGVPSALHMNPSPFVTFEGSCSVLHEEVSESIALYPWFIKVWFVAWSWVRTENYQALAPGFFDANKDVPPRELRPVLVVA